MQLSMNVSTDSYRCPHSGRIGLLGEDSSGSFSDKFDLFFGNGLETLEVGNNGIDLGSFAHILNKLTIKPIKHIPKNRSKGSELHIRWAIAFP